MREREEGGGREGEGGREGKKGREGGRGREGEGGREGERRSWREGVRETSRHESQRHKKNVCSFTRSHETHT